MEFVTIEFNGLETVIPKSDLEWFVKEKGAKLIGKEQKQENKKNKK